ncbi:MAG: hypothetical protein IPP25_18350 [Saprospiraceae bacterium]|nr:hypothetical protein [Candidatus Opimibacter skivensis]
MNRIFLYSGSIWLNLVRERRELTVDGHFSALAWSPDGKKLICASAPTSLVDDSYMSVTLSIVDVATMKVLSTIDHQERRAMRSGVLMEHRSPS